ncbi:YdcF family protein [Facklamia sp. DSM 111018]|uniref:YdcF family protein n=1 Tax=Facklamia lactis TaxID=2749967 RepID=A0ABS0LSV9_9LACT|nr:ElyC/SanA/YdcF family protein [Facklamia lactis]MBG9981425.1 YdcF family protein [Facklamia lactis]MBG9987099.1 YdcF family protein [Facklamia lactis]
MKLFVVMLFQTLKRTFLLAFLILGIMAILNVFVIVSAIPQFKDISELRESAYDNSETPIMVLGAGVIENKYPSQILAQRLACAVELNQVLKENPLIMSGDHRESNYNEVAVMKEYLLERKIEGDQIYLDHAGYSTYDSLFRLKKNNEVDKVIIVTQAYHLPRALMIARRLGIEAVGVAAKETSTTRWQRESREFLARIKDFGVSYLHLEIQNRPTLDYPIDLNQSGNRTDKKETMK